jgi:putative ABC transport system substrate-binding protein
MKMQRRSFLALLGGAAAAWPRAARAQQSGQVRRIGVLTSGEDENDPRLQLFRQSMQRLGWTEGSNTQVDVRHSAGNAIRGRAYAAELVRLKPEVFLAGGVLALTQLRQETQTIPIVFMGVSDPVGQGFVASLARPGGIITGFTLFEFSQAAKWLEALKEIVPGVARVALMYVPDNPNSAGYLRSIESVAPSFAVEIIQIPVRNGADIERALSTFSREGGGGLIVLPAGIYSQSNRKLLIELAARYRLPAIYAMGLFADEGGLISYSNDGRRQGQQAAEYVDRILRGERPADLPVQQPTKFELVLNLKTAKGLALDISTSILLRADKVIE